MTWILVWWIIHAKYMQIQSIPNFRTEAECVEAAQHLSAPPNTKINWHCGMQ